MRRFRSSLRLQQFVLSLARYNRLNYKSYKEENVPATLGQLPEWIDVASNKELLFQVLPSVLSECGEGTVLLTDDATPSIQKYLRTLSQSHNIPYYYGAKYQGCESDTVVFVFTGDTTAAGALSSLELMSRATERLVIITLDVGYTNCKSFINQLRYCNG